jgi:GDP-L-fucose synthase
MLDKYSRLFIAGHNGMVGSAIARRLRSDGYDQLILDAEREVDLRDSAAVARFLGEHRPDVVILAAAKVGGIQANIQHPAEFLYDNLMIQSNVIHHSSRVGVKKFCFLGSSCIYPRDCPQPMKEAYLLTGPLEPTNEGYALAKIAGLKMVEYYHRQYGFNGISPMPCNLYGPNETFDLQTSHVLSALVRRFVDAHDTHAPTVTLWGTGQARREFMHVDDCARAVLFLLEHYESPEIINVGAGQDVSIAELAALIAEKVSYEGKVEWDKSKPDGMPRKCLDVSRISAMGFVPEISLNEGVERMIIEYRERKKSGAIAEASRT